MAKPISEARLAVVRAWQAAKERGITSPALADLIGLSPQAAQLAETTVRILRVADVSQAKSSATMFAWQRKTIQGLAPRAGTAEPEGVVAWLQKQEAAGQAVPISSELLAGFSATTADQILDALVVRDGEPVHEAQTSIESEDEDKKEEELEGRRTERGSVARPEMLDLWRQWQESSEQDRKAAAEQARADERRVADAELRAAADKLAAEQRVAEAQLAAERAKGSARASASRLYAIIGISVALAAGAVGGVAWSRSQPQPVAPAVQLPQGVQPAPLVAPPIEPKPESKAPPVDQSTEKPKEGGEVVAPKDTVKPEGTEVKP